MNFNADGFLDENTGYVQMAQSSRGGIFQQFYGSNTYGAIRPLVEAVNRGLRN